MSKSAGVVSLIFATGFVPGCLRRRHYDRRADGESFSIYDSSGSAGARLHEGRRARHEAHLHAVRPELAGGDRRPCAVLRRRQQRVGRYFQRQRTMQTVLALNDKFCSG